MLEKLVKHDLRLGATLQLLGIESEPLESVVTRQFKKKGDAVITENVGVARTGYEYAAGPSGVINGQLGGPGLSVGYRHGF